MKTFLTVILFISFTITVFGQNQPDSLGFTNKAAAKNLTINGVKEGKWCENIFDIEDITTDTHSPYYMLTVYKAGKPNGIRRIYYRRGQQLYIETPYINGRKNGVEKSYYSKTKVEKETPWINDTINGIVKVYYRKGGLSSETIYVKGKIISSKKGSGSV